MKFFYSLLISCLFLTAAQARQIADVDIAESISREDAPGDLQLNGAGIRYKFIFKIYVGALYLEKKTQSAEEAISSNGANRVLMHFLYDEVSKEKLVNAWIEGFESNISADQFKSLKPRIDQFNNFFETLTTNDVVLLDFMPGKGTRVTIKGKEKGVIEGDDFNQALLKIWLGKEPVTDDLKDALLGFED